MEPMWETNDPISGTAGKVTAGPITIISNSQTGLVLLVWSRTSSVTDESDQQTTQACTTDTAAVVVVNCHRGGRSRE